MKTRAMRAGPVGAKLMKARLVLVRAHGHGGFNGHGRKQVLYGHFKDISNRRDYKVSATKRCLKVGLEY